MERTDPTPEPASETRPAAVSSQRGLALFGVLILVVIFTLLGVGAVTLAQRESRNSGSMIDIKSRQAGAYAGLVFALGEFQRDPDNFAALLEAWRTKSVTLYGTLANPLPPLYLSFDTSGGAVALTKNKPAPFTVPGSAYKIVVELAGVQIPATPTAAPVIVLRATGTGRSGDEQTVLGAYAVRNIRLGAGAGAVLPISHALFVNGPGFWNNQLATTGGDVFFGGNTTLNSATKNVSVTGGGLKVNGTLTVLNGIDFTVDDNSWVTGNLVLNINQPVIFKKNLVVDGSTIYNNNADLQVNGSLLTQGAGGIPNIRAGTLTVGKQLAVTGGPVSTGNNGGSITVGEDAYLFQLNRPIGQSFTLNVTKRLELSRNAGLVQSFNGNGTWGQFVARSLNAGSAILENSNTPGITINGTSWVETPTNLQLGTPGSPGWPGPPGPPASPINMGASIYGCNGCGANWNLNPSWAKSSASLPVASGISTAVNGQGFDAIKPPYTTNDLGMPTSPAAESEVGFDITTDPALLAKAVTLGAGGGLCSDQARMCGASMNKARNDDIASGSAHFYNGYFVAKIGAYMSMTWDAGGAQTSPLQGKWLIIVPIDMASGADPWPTTADNSADVNNPVNIQFIYVPAGGNILPGFQPRWKNGDPTILTFTGYIRMDAPGTYTWDPSLAIQLRGAFHAVAAGSTLSINNNASTIAPQITLDPAVLGSLGAAFGSSFTDPVTGNPLATAGPTGFVATENWIQFQPLGELR